MGEDSLSGGTSASAQRLLNRAPSDPDVINAVIGRAYQRLLDLTRRLARRFPSLLRQSESAELLHSSYTRIHNAIAEVKPGTLAELMRLAAQQVRWEMLDLVRRETLRRAHNIEELERTGYESDKSDKLDPGYLLDVIEKLDDLPDEQRNVVLLIFFKGLSITEAALLLGVTERTVRRRWEQANLALRQMLDPENP